MAPAVTRAIRLLSSLHGQSPTHKANAVASMTIFSKEHFPKFLGFVCFSGFFSGFCVQQSLRNKEVRVLECGNAGWGVATGLRLPMIVVLTIFLIYVSMQEEKEIRNVYAQRRFTVVLKNHQQQRANTIR